MWMGIILLLCGTIPTFAITSNENSNVSNEENKIVLEHADNWDFNDYQYPGAHRLSGNVVFSHAGMIMYCDSAVYYINTNSFEAMGNVSMHQGDTLTLVGDSLYYDGQAMLAQMRNNVILTHNQQNLYTDSLNYDRVDSIGYFFEGGTLIDGENKLTSDWGEYLVSTKEANFLYDVTLTNPKLEVKSDTLNYNTVSKWAHVIGLSTIKSGNSVINTENGFYNTELEIARLYNRSLITSEQRTMIGDSLFYYKQNGDMFAFGDIDYHDKGSKNLMRGNYTWYNEQTGDALCTDSALIMDYSSGIDTLYVHADSIKLKSFNFGTDSLWRKMDAFFHVRAYRCDVQAVCDSLTFSTLSRVMTLHRDPIVWSDNRQVLGEQIDIHFNDSTIDSVYVCRQALLVEHVDSVHFNQISGHEMRSYYHNGEIKENQVIGNVRVVFFPLEKDSLVLYQVYLETSKLHMLMQDRKLDKLWTPPADGHFYAVGMAPKSESKLENFEWFDYIRPLHKNDIFEWRPKHKGTELKSTIRRQAPLQHLKL